MATLEAGSINDLITLTLRNLGKGEWTDVMQALQDYPIMRTWLGGGRVSEGRGYGLRWRIADKTQGGSGFVGLYEEDDVDRGDHVVEATAPWRNISRSFGIDHREVDMNAGPEELVDTVEMERNGMWVDAAEDFELGAWQVPGTSDTLLPYGIPYYVVYNATTGFNGGAPNSHTTVAGINPTTRTRWKNYTAKYTNVTEDDLVSLMSSAFRKIRFRPPTNVKGETGETYSIYTDETTMKALEKLARERNDQMGFDLLVTQDSTMFKRVNMTWVPYLDDNAASGSNPIYMIGHNSFKVKVLAGWNGKQTGPKVAGKQHNVSETFLDWTFNFQCSNRRAQALLAKADPF